MPALPLFRLACRRLPANLSPAPLTAVVVGGSCRLGFGLWLVRGFYFFVR
jgi:hypothetical protein